MKFTYKGCEYDFDVQGEIDNATKKLKKENKKLKEKIICLESDACNEVSQAQYDDMEEDFKEEIKKLKEENKKLAELHNIATTLANSDNEYLQEKIEKLEKENKDYLFDVIDNTGFDKDVFDEEADFDIELFIHNVKNKLDELTTKKDKFKELFMKEKKELKKVKKEVEKLKEENNKLLLKETQTNNENVSIKSEIEELKEYKKKIVNFKLMLKNTTENDSDYDTWDIIEKTLKINASGNDISGSDDVVDENQNLVEYYKFIVHTLDPKCNMVNSITKEDIDDYTSDAELGKFLYKEFHLDSDEDE